MLSILAFITPWLFVGFDTIPQTAEEFDFCPKNPPPPDDQFHRLRRASLVVLIAVAIIIPYTDLLGQNHSWTTGAVANMAFRQVRRRHPRHSGHGRDFHGHERLFHGDDALLFSMGRGKFLHPWFVKVHPKHGTPTNAVLFTLCLTLIAPWFGRSALN